MKYFASAVKDNGERIYLDIYSAYMDGCPVSPGREDGVPYYEEKKF